MVKNVSMRRVNIGLFMVFLVIGLACSKSSEVTPEIQERQRKELQRKTEEELASKYNASLDWGEGLEGHLRAFTIEVENALIRPNGQPVVFVAYADDLMKRDDKYFARFYRVEHPKIYFILECKTELAEQLLSDSERVLRDYAVVAVVSSVARAALAVNARVLTNEETELEIDTPDVFIARGSCLEAQMMR
jgi:hypothetical protein